MQIGGDWLTAAPTQRVFQALSDAGFQVYAVGGCVRNALFGVPVSDVDMATDARPDQVTRIAGDAGLKAVPTGIDHGTVTVISNSIPHEITTFRKDVATDGRRATVAYSDTMIDDARRRDFTVNALYADAAGTVFDPLGGMGDITARRIRFIEDANRRIAEDYLRILRFFRFYAWYGDPAQGPDPEGLAACAAHVAGIAGLSRERVGAEMKKLLAAPDPAPASGAMAASGALSQVLSGAGPEFIAPLVHLEQANGIAPRWHRRLAALGGGKPASALRLSRAEARALVSIANAMRSGESIAVNAYLFGGDAALDAALVTAATLGTPMPGGFSADIAKGAAAVFPLRGGDLVAKTGAGPQLGAELERLERLWIDSGFTLDKQTLLQS